MKKVVFYTLLTILFLMSCSDKVNFSYNDATNNGIDFFFKNTKKINLSHDIENSILSGEFQVNDKEKYLYNLKKNSLKTDYALLYQDDEVILFFNKKDKNIVKINIYDESCFFEMKSL